MAEVAVRCVATPDGYACEVTVREGGGVTEHRLTFDRAEVARLVPGQPPTAAIADDLARATFRFLLEREPKESIMRTFGLADVRRYFPDFKAESERKPDTRSLG